MAAKASKPTELIVALDCATANEARRQVESLRGLPVVFKVGLELFAAAGPDFVRELTQAKYRVFVDLKLYDIPNTVAKAVDSVGKLGAELLTVHLSGGSLMLDAAVRAAPAGLRILGVSVLTSFSEQSWMETSVAITGGCQPQAENRVARSVGALADLGTQSGVTGFVCSSHEIAALKNKDSSRYLVVPGIRPAGVASGDQARVMTPYDAAIAGADAIVVGRPITQASDPRQAASAVLEELSKAAQSAQG